MSKVRVPLHQNPRGFATLDTEATNGAVIGTNVWNPDGSLFAPGAAATPEAGNNVAVAIWRYVLEIPPNVTAVAALASDGFVRRNGDAWLASPIANVDLSSASTSGLAEGYNLYFTDERAIAAGTGEFFAIGQRFAELPNETAVIEARTNLGLQVIDAGTFN